MKKKALSLLLAITLCLGLLPGAALALVGGGITEVPGLVTGPDADFVIRGGR